jgi:hypothetical protein
MKDVKRNALFSYRIGLILIALLNLGLLICFGYLLTGFTTEIETILTGFNPRNFSQALLSLTILCWMFAIAIEILMVKTILKKQTEG